MYLCFFNFRLISSSDINVRVGVVRLGDDKRSDTLHVTSRTESRLQPYLQKHDGLFAEETVS